MTTSEKIRKARIEKGLSQQELADKMGYRSRSSVNKLENEKRNIPRSQIVKLAQILEVTPSYLMGWEDSAPSGGSSPKHEPFNILDSTKIRQIPVFNSISAGFGAYASSNIVEYIPLFIRSDSEADETICIKVQGNSMYPKIEDGDIIVVHKQDEVDSGSIAALMIEDEGFVKKFVYDRTHAEFISLNPEYPPRVFKGNEMNAIKVVGLVKKIVKNV